MGEPEPAAASPSRLFSSRYPPFLIVLLTVVLVGATWAHWGSPRIDGGREVYVPARILEGDLLYRDLWYPYGPVAPYVQAALFACFGVRLHVLYLFGSLLTMVSAVLLHSVGRRFLPPAGALLVAVVFVFQGIQPKFHNFIFPYSHATTIGMLLSIACGYFITFPGNRLRFFAFGSAAAGLALLSKPEFGIACYGAMGTLVVVHALRREFPLALRQLFTISASLLIPISGFGFFVWQTSAQQIFLENFHSMPGSYFMSTYGKAWIEFSGMRTSSIDLVKALISAILALLVWLDFFLIIRWARDNRRVPAAAGIGALALLIFAMMRFNPFPWLYLRDLVFPRGMFLIAAAVGLPELVRVLRERRRPAEPAFLVVLGLLLGTRVMSQVVPFHYPIYYTWALVILTLLGVWNLGHFVLGSGGFSRRACEAAFAIQTLLLIILLLPDNANRPAPMVTSIGTIYTRESDAALYPALAEFVRRQATLGHRTLILPEEPLLYVLSNTEAPGPLYQLIPGMLPPEKEADYIALLERAGIDFILLSNRATPEYGVPFFGTHYNQGIMNWMQSEFVPVGEFGSFDRRIGSPFGVLVLKRRD